MTTMAFGLGKPSPGQQEIKFNIALTKILINPGASFEHVLIFKDFHHIRIVAMMIMYITITVWLSGEDLELILVRGERMTLTTGTQ